MMQEEVSEERREINMMAEKINALTLRLDELQCKLGLEQPRALHEGVSEDPSEKDSKTEQPDALAMTEQIEALAQRLVKQRRKHEFEQVRVQQEIDGLRTQIHQITVMLVSPGKFGIQARSSSAPCGSRYHLDGKSKAQVIQAHGSLVDGAQTEGHQEAKDFSCTVVDRKMFTQRGSQETDVQYTDPVSNFFKDAGPHACTLSRLRTSTRITGYEIAGVFSLL